MESPGAIFCGCLALQQWSVIFDCPSLQFENRFVNVFQFANVAAIYVITPFMIYPEYHFALCLLYLVCGIGSQYLTATFSKGISARKMNRDFQSHVL